MNTPIPCSDDVGDDYSFQTGREVPVADLQAAARAQDLGTDAERAEFLPRQPPPSRPPAAAAAAAPGHWGDGGAGKTPSTIEMKGQNWTISATGLAEAIKPGVNFQLGHTNFMTVSHNRDGSSTVTTGRPQIIPNQLPITASQARPEEAQLAEISKALGVEWRELGRALGLKDATLDQISMDYAVMGQLEVNYQMMRKWLQSTHPAKVCTLARALVNAGRGDLADKLSQTS